MIRLTFLLAASFLGLPLPWGNPPPEPPPNLTFVGNESFTDQQLVAGLRRYRVGLDAPLEVTDADDAAFFLGEFYYTRGFPDARVTYDYHGNAATFTIDEGRQVFLGTLTFEGNSVLSNERLSDIIQASIRQTTLNPFGRLRYVNSAVSAGVEAIRNVYIQNGYLQAEIFTSEMPADTGVMNLAFSVDEGPLFVVSAIQLEGGDSYHAEVMDLVSRHLQAPLTPDLELLLRTRILDYLRNHGHYDAEVEAERLVDFSNASAELVFHLVPGGVYHIGNITVSGNRFTQTRAILSRLGIRPNSLYRAKPLNQGTQRLWFSGAFSEAETQLTPREGGWLDLDVNVTETRAKQVTATVGAGQWERVFADITYVDRNFLGTLNRLAVRGYASTRSYGTQVTLSNPWMFNSETIGSIGGFFFRNEVPAYRALTYGGILGLERRFSQTNLTGYRLSYQWKRLAEIDIFGDDSDEEANDFEQTYTVGMLQFAQTLDKRNDLLTPMKGYLLRYEAGVASQALAGDQSFFRFTGQATFYQPLREITKERPFVPFVTLNSRAGVIIPFADTDEVPIPERFFLGGVDTVRSFQFDGMAPRDGDGDPLGGQVFWLGNLELDWPIWRALYLAGFTDIGNLSPSLDELDSEYTRVGVGTGLRFYTPIGALRVDYGYNLIRRDGDPIGAWQFGFGFTF